tara:strand:- start:787 stop:1194 length:408 start_codon:yes stop_codon:yes gene_type:complete
MKLIASLLLTLTLSHTALADVEKPNSTMQAQQLIAEVLNNVDWQLLIRVQQKLLVNMDLLLPYTQEYLQCLQQEGVIKEGQNLDIPTIWSQANNVSNTCSVILSSLIGKLDFDITQEELERGLSPEYRDMLKKSL